MTSSSRDLRTRFAIQALDFSDAFNTGLGSMRLPPGDYKPELTAPEGPSTGGGVQAMQHIRLVPGRPELPTIVVGSANQRTATAELRSFDYVDAVHRERFKKPVELDRGHYGVFVESARNFFDTHRLTTTISAPPPELTKLAPQARRRVGAPTVLVGVAVGLLAAGGILALLLR